MTTIQKVEISVITPVFRSVESIAELCSRLDATLSQITHDYEIILVDDASPDESWQIIKELAAKDNRIKGIHLSRNFGQHYAITAGLDFSKGNWVVVMDCDLQDVPEEITKMYNKAYEGYDIVVGLRKNRQDSLFKKLSSKLFYKAYSYFTETEIDNRIGNFGIYSRKVINSIKTLREQNRSFGLFAIWVGYNRTGIEVNHAARKHGRTSYDFKRRVKLALESIISHSNKLLYLAIKLGLGLSLLSLSYAFWLAIKYFFWSTPVAGWTSVMVSIYFTTGLIIGTMGIVGLYVAKIFNEVKNRPLYLIESTTFELSISSEAE